MSKSLHIGGELDGRRIALPPDMEIHRAPDGLYKRMPVAGNSKRWDIFAHEMLSADDVMLRLIDGYNPEIKETRAHIDELDPMSPVAQIR